MGIVGDHPEGGIRFDLSRVSSAPPWVYEGSAFTREARHALRATVDAEREVTVDAEEQLPREVVRRLRLLLKTAAKLAAGDQGQGTPPRRIHRWRAE